MTTLRSEYMTDEEAELSIRWRQAIDKAGRAPSERHHLAIRPNGGIGLALDERFAAMGELERLLSRPGPLEEIEMATGHARGPSYLGLNLDMPTTPA